MPSYSNTFENVQSAQGLGVATSAVPTPEPVQLGSIMPGQAPTGTVPFQGANQVNAFQGSTETKGFQGPTNTIPFQGSNEVVGYPQPTPKVSQLTPANKGPLSKSTAGLGDLPAFHAGLGGAQQSQPGLGLNGQNLFNNSQQQVQGLGMANPDTVNQRYDGGTVIDGSRGVAGTGLGFNNQPMSKQAWDGLGGTERPDLGLNIHGAPVQSLGIGGSYTEGGVGILPWEQNSQDALSHSLTRDEYNAATLPNQNKFNPNAQAELGIARQEANTNYQTADNNRFKQAYTTTTNPYTNEVTKVPDGTFDSRTGVSRAQQADADANAASQNAQRQADADAKRAQKEGLRTAQEGTQRAKNMAAQGREKQKRIMSMFNSDNPTKRRIAEKYFGGL